MLSDLALVLGSDIAPPLVVAVLFSIRQWVILSVPAKLFSAIPAPEPVLSLFWMVVLVRLIVLARLASATKIAPPGPPASLSSNWLPLIVRALALARVIAPPLPVESLSRKCDFWIVSPPVPER